MDMSKLFCKDCKVELHRITEKNKWHPNVPWYCKAPVKKTLRGKETISNTGAFCIVWQCQSCYINASKKEKEEDIKSLGYEGELSTD